MNILEAITHAPTHTSRDVVLTRKVWERTHKLAIVKQLQTHFKEKHEKNVGTPFPHFYCPTTPLHARRSYWRRR